MIGYVYKIENIITGDFYIGKTRDLKARISSHKNNSSNKRVRESINKYGKENHVFLILHCGEISNDYISMCEAHEINLNIRDNKMMNACFESIKTSSDWIHPKIAAFNKFRKDTEKYWKGMYVKMMRNKYNKKSFRIPNNKSVIKDCVLKGLFDTNQIFYEDSRRGNGINFNSDWRLPKELCFGEEKYMESIGYKASSPKQSGRKRRRSVVNKRVRDLS